MTWIYERGEGRYKHCWRHDVAGFEPDGKGPIGKCPKHLTEGLAQEILNTGIPFYESDESQYPERIYAVYHGVVYEAVPTRPGVSYHGYPWRGDIQGRPRLPRCIKRGLEEMAAEADELDAYRKWLKKYGN